MVTNKIVNDVRHLISSEGVQKMIMKFFSQTSSRVNDIFEAFLMQTQIKGFELCSANDLRKLVVEYMATNCEEFKVK